jgi:small conductance mechanosensitive channel
VVVLAVIIWTARRALARSRAAVARATSDKETRSARRELAITYVIRVAAWSGLVFMILILLGVNLTALVAGAGFVGAGLAFGAQNVVKDYLAGFYVVVEDQYAVGDTVELGLIGGGTATVSGVVEDLTFRRTAIRRGEGSVISIGNGSVIFSQNLSRAPAAWWSGSRSLRPQASNRPGRTSRRWPRPCGPTPPSPPWSGPGRSPWASSPPGATR